jgi:FkbM family methyltransferase
MMLKQMLAGTGLGNAAVRLRDKVELIRSALSESAELGDKRNNAIALRLVIGLRRHGRTFIDVGAHIGSVLGEVARTSPGQVIAFEAIPAKAVHLARKFPGVVVHNCALLDREGETRFYVDNARSGYSSLSQRDGDVTEIVVPVSRMDTLITQDDVDVIKIDVEGAELGVLRGAEEVIVRCRPVVLFESGPGDVMGYTKEDLWRWFDERDYLIYFPDRVSRAARAATLEVFIDSHEYPRRSMNYFAIPAERLEEVSARARTLLNEITS